MGDAGHHIDHEGGIVIFPAVAHPGHQPGLRPVAELVADVLKHRIALANDLGIEHQHGGAVERLAQGRLMGMGLGGTGGGQQRDLLRDGEQTDGHRRADKGKIDGDRQVLTLLHSANDHLLGKEATLALDKGAIDQGPELLLGIGGIEQGLHGQDGGTGATAQLIVGDEGEVLA